MCAVIFFEKRWNISQAPAARSFLNWLPIVCSQLWARQRARLLFRLSSESELSLSRSTVAWLRGQNGRYRNCWRAPPLYIRVCENFVAAEAYVVFATWFSRIMTWKWNSLQPAAIHESTQVWLHLHTHCIKIQPGNYKDREPIYRIDWKSIVDMNNHD